METFTFGSVGGMGCNSPCLPRTLHKSGCLIFEDQFQICPWIVRICLIDCVTDFADGIITSPVRQRV